MVDFEEVEEIYHAINSSDESIREIKQAVADVLARSALELQQCESWQEAVDSLINLLIELEILLREDD